MRFSRLVMSGDEIPTTEIAFDERITVVDLPESDLTDIHVALASVLRGEPTQTAARRFSGYIQLGGLEIEVAGELARHFGDSLAGRQRIVGALSQRRSTVSDRPVAGGPELGVSTESESIALRAALELHGEVAPLLAAQDISDSLASVEAQKRALAMDATSALADAEEHRRQALDALRRLSELRTAVEGAHSETMAARPSGSFTRRWRRRRHARLSRAETELLATGDFDSYDDYRRYADETERACRAEVQAAETATQASQTELIGIENGSATTPRALSLISQEFLLRLHQQSPPAGREPTEFLGDHYRGSVREAMGALLRNRGEPVERWIEPIQPAIEWLDQIDGQPLRNDLRRRAELNADPAPVLGSVPLVLDRTFEGLRVGAARHAIGALDPFVGEVQLIILGTNPVVSDWVDRHGASATASSSANQL